MRRLAWLLLALSGSAHAEAPNAETPRVLRIATSAPDGTTWARELKAFAREIATESKGAVLVKWYFGGIAGDEVEAAKRVQRDQLDGVASGGQLCQRFAPSLRVLRIPGLFESREEIRFVLGRLSETVQEEFRKAGHVWLAGAGLGPDGIYSREAIQSFDQLKKTRLWRWDVDDVPILVEKEMGLSIQPGTLESVEPSFSSGQLGAFYAVPAAALAFQWFKNVGHLMDIHTGFLHSCIFVKIAAFDQLSIEQQRVVRAASAKLSGRLDEAGHQMDGKLLDEVFPSHGVKREPYDRVRADYLAAARGAVDRLGDKLVPTALLERVRIALSEFRKH
jgi:TRAP-type C4-dicarboxylate transport system substrate-binding protein